MEKIKTIKLSLLKKNTEIDKNNKAEYVKLASATFKITSQYNEEFLQKLLSSMFDDLLKIKTFDAPDYLGLWIVYDSITLDNAISLSALESIKEYSKEEINPIWEFFKMTLPANDYFQNNFTS